MPVSCSRRCFIKPNKPFVALSLVSVNGAKVLSKVSESVSATGFNAANPFACANLAWKLGWVSRDGACIPRPACSAAAPAS